MRLATRGRAPASAPYWEHRYRNGGGSGPGSYGKFAEFKAEVINQFVAEADIHSVIEFGCGDGNQLELALYRRYLGFDISESAVARCRSRFADDPTKTFHQMKEYSEERAALALSLDVIFHLLEDEAFVNYMSVLFRAAERFVIIYSSNTDDNRGFEGTHVRHRRFLPWVETRFPHWKLFRRADNRFPYRGDHLEGSFADFYFFERI